MKKSAFRCSARFSLFFLPFSFPSSLQFTFSFVCVGVEMSSWCREERERETERQRDREKETDRQTEAETERETKRQRERLEKKMLDVFGVIDRQNHVWQRRIRRRSSYQKLGRMSGWVSLYTTNWQKRKK